LWSFGCQKKGGLYNHLVNKKRAPSILSKQWIKDKIKKSLKMEYPSLNPELWRTLYSDSDNVENFNAWLELILSPDKYFIGEGYKTNKMSNFAGLLTYRYLNLYTYRKNFENIDSNQKLEQYDIEENFMNFIIRNESLEEDLIEVGEQLEWNMDVLNSILNANQKRTNNSKRNRDYKHYYNDQSISLVSKYDDFLIKKYGYSFE
jgi:hypothetical protein